MLAKLKIDPKDLRARQPLSKALTGSRQVENSQPLSKALTSQPLSKALTS
jgi:hypothetical protein